MTLAVNFMGLSLANPIIVAAGPWSRNGAMIKKALLAGAGAVVTETIASELNIDVRPRIAFDGSGMQNIRLYSDLVLEQWEQELAVAKSVEGIVIANICAQTPSEIGYIAAKVEKMGADAIELGLASPMGEGLEVMTADAKFVFEMTRKVVESVNIPVMVKLSQNVTNLSKIALAVQKSGGSGISAIDTVRCILGVDVKTRKPRLATYGGYSGPPIRPLGLAAVATIAQSSHLPVCGIGGIEHADHVLEYLMLGASVVQMGTSLMVNGFSRIAQIKEGLNCWMAEEGVKDLADLRGVALSKIQSFDEIQVEPKTSCMIRSCESLTCLKCVNGCIYEAISVEDGKVQLNPEKCRGCGLCTDICPEGKFELSWT